MGTGDTVSPIEPAGISLAVAEIVGMTTAAD
jgi:hypothetical protein